MSSSTSGKEYIFVAKMNKRINLIFPKDRIIIVVQYDQEININIKLTYNSIKFNFNLMQDHISTTILCFTYGNQLLTMRNHIKLTYTSSLSFILTLAEHLEYQQKILPPNAKQYCPDIVFTGEKYSINFYEAWCDYLKQIVKNKNVYINQQQAILIGILQDQNIYQYLKSNNYFIAQTVKPSGNNLTKKDIVFHLFAEDTTKHEKIKNNRIGIINFSTSILNKNKLAPKINIEAIYLSIFYRNGDEWACYEILKNQIPTVEEITSFDTIMLTGSSYSVYNENQLIVSFCRNMFDAIKHKPKLKVIGACFGHQLFAYYNQIEVKRQSFIQGPQEIVMKIEKQNFHIPYLEQILKNDSKPLKLYEFHGDFVMGIPKGFVRVGRSESCNVQILVSDDLRIFTYQFHPQYSVQYVKHLESRWYNKQFTPIQPSLFHQNHRSEQLFRRAIRKLIDWEMKSPS